MSVRSVLRGGLAFLTVTQLAVGFVGLLLPRWFFAIPWVGMRMPYNEHLMLDYGAMNLATSVVLVTAVVVASCGLIRIALITYLVFAVSHLVIHTRFLHHLTPAEAVWLLVALSLAVVIPSVLLVLTTRLKDRCRCAAAGDTATAGGGP
ncbi:hypothetical protein FHR81_002690 [Actinoalloteichus hoggarensis]|uniref:Uncharacterized protein n=1 Tax=Actinoalloteichus hoggarensis TaxID=1470176 RepID=A0A221VXR4_9PSEU|nr:hypothetical protein [Actinoalloteichus hoggarensis]ASO18288.1 hypothetical protein AHOG_03150 [Actinoalloteichus hoggarensis]MBB5921650.1 hypothetical protein [Actinoalloteichus hoggarensis]